MVDMASRIADAMPQPSWQFESLTSYQFTNLPIYPMHNLLSLALVFICADAILRCRHRIVRQAVAVDPFGPVVNVGFLGRAVALDGPLVRRGIVHGLFFHRRHPSPPSKRLRWRLL